MPCAIWYHLYNLKNVKNIHGGVLLVVACTLLKVTLLHGCFSRFLNCTNGAKSRKTSHVDLWGGLWNASMQKQPSRGVPMKRCSENMQQIYRRTPLAKCDFDKVAKELYWITLQHGCSPANFLHIFRTAFPENTSGGLLLLVSE